MNLKTMLLLGGLGYYVYNQSKKNQAPIVIPGVGSYNAGTKIFTYTDPNTGATMQKKL